jgi:hypothetical protein
MHRWIKRIERLAESKRKELVEDGSLCGDLVFCSTETASSALGPASIRVDSSLCAPCFSTMEDLRQQRGW